MTEGRAGTGPPLPNQISPAHFSPAPALVVLPDERWHHALHKLDLQLILSLTGSAKVAAITKCSASSLHPLLIGFDGGDRSNEVEVDFLA